MSRSRNFHPSRAREQAVTGRKSVYLWVWFTVVFLQAALAVSAQAQTIDWIRQFGTSGMEGSTWAAVAADTSGNAYMAGRTDGTFSGQTSAGGFDVFLRKYDASGNELWTRQFGTTGHDRGYGVAVDVSGNVYVGGTSGACSPARMESS